MMLLSQLKTTGKYLYFISMFMLGFTLPVHAYIDPSVATYAIQAIAGIAITLGAVGGVYWRRIVRWFRGERIHADNKKARSSIRANVLPETNQTDIIEDNSEPYTFKHFIFDSIPAVFLMLAISFMIGYYAPMEIFLHNQTEFWFDYGIIQPVLVHLFFALFFLGILVMAVGYFIHKKLYYILLSCALTVFLILYFQGTLLSGSLPVMDGSPLSLSGHTGDIAKSILLFFGISFCVTVAARLLKKKHYFIIISVLSIAILLINFFTLNRIIEKTDGKKDKEYKTVSKMNEFTFSSDTNIIILLMDSMDGDMTSTVLENETYSKYMEDFTFYPDTLGGYSYTSRSIPLILTGEWYENKQDFETYYKNAIRQSSLLNTLKDNHYHMNIYEKSAFYADDYSDYENFITDKPKIKEYAPVMALELKLALYKYMPYFIKPKFVFNPNRFEQYEDIGQDVYYWYIDTFCRHVRNFDFEITQEKQFKYFHLEGAYAPYDLTEEVMRMDSGEGTYETEIRACFETAHQLIMRLKKAGIYDNSVIIIMSDHGFNPNGLEEGRQNPAFLVKGLNEHHEMYISDKAVSYGNLQSAFIKLINGEKSFDLFEEDQGKERRYLHYSKEDPDTLIEYILNRNAGNWDNLVLSGNVYRTGGDE